MILNKKLTNRILSNIDLINNNSVVLLLTNPHHIDLFRKIIDKLFKNNNKKIIFAIDDRIDKKSLQNFNKRTVFFFVTQQLKYRTA